MRSAAFYLSGLIKPACCEEHFEASSNIFKKERGEVRAKQHAVEKTEGKVQ